MFHNARVMLKKNVILLFATLWVFLLAANTEVRSESSIATPPPMILPIECELGWNCWIANYVDHDRGTDSADYRCGNQTYNNHRGTDFMIRNYREMQGGVLVRAAADGVVVGTRDKMKDVDYRRLPKETISKKPCGNGVRLDHGKGWITQYCHLRKNSVKVKKGQKVKAGDILGMVGNSGFAAFPHLHFQVEYIEPGSGKRRGSIVDPFVGTSRIDKCEASEKTLWPQHVVDDLKYNRIDIFDVGFSASKPKYSGLVEGLYDDETLSVRSPQLFLWGRFLHVQKGDQLSFTITGPDGDEIMSYSNTIDKTQAYRSLHAGVRRPSLNWEPGVYHGYIKLIRQDENGGRIYRNETTITLK